jgi:outer membrane lipoprotein-sorting protein
MMIFALLLLAVAANAQTPSGDWIIEKVDENIGSDNKVLSSTMIVKGRRSVRTISSRSWMQGRAKSFTEYLDPPRERGIKMLKLGDQLWTYTPETDRTIQISGHMLRQSVMGSDLSYEDMMEDPRLQNLYTAEVVAEDSLSERPCWVLDLTAREDDIAYHHRKVWVDREQYVMLKENRYAKSGKLLKTTEVKEVKLIEGRWMGTKVVFRDVLKKGEGTEFVIDSIQFDADIPEYIFTKAALKK